MRAAASGNTDVCRELYNAGANPNIIEPKTGRTALHFCAEFDQAQVIFSSAMELRLIVVNKFGHLFLFSCLNPG